jgi:hypothetical protein
VGYATEGNPPARIDPRDGYPAGSGVELLGDGGRSLYTVSGVTAKLYLKTIGVDDGWCALAVDLPLTAYYDEANPEATAGHDLWRLRTGINYHQLDYGPVSAASYSPGGMTLLRVGNPAGGGLVITGSFPPPLPNFTIQPLLALSIDSGGNLKYLITASSPAADSYEVRWTNTDRNAAWFAAGNGTLEPPGTILTGTLAGTGVPALDTTYSAVVVAKKSGYSDGMSAAAALATPITETVIEMQDGTVHHLWDDYPSWWGASFNNRAIMLRENYGGTPIGIHTGDIKKVTIGHDLGGATVLPERFLMYNSAVLVEVDLSPLTSVQTIGEQFLLLCTGLTSLDLSPLSNVQSIDSSFLNGSSGLSGIVDMGDITADKIAQSGSFYNSGTGPIYVKDAAEVTNYRNKFGGYTDPDRFQVHP